MIMSYTESSLQIIAEHFHWNDWSTDTFADALMPTWRKAFPFEGDELEDASAPAGCSFDDVNEFKAGDEVLKARIKACPRGTWTFIQQRMPTGDLFTDVLMADGRGGVHVENGNSMRLVTPQIAGEGMIRSEIYLAREGYRKVHYAQESQVIMRSNGWKRGTRFTNTRIAGVHFRQARIIGTKPSGQLVVSATGRSVRGMVTKAHETFLCWPRSIEVQR